MRIDGMQRKKHKLEGTINMRILNLSGEMLRSFENNHFSMDGWKSYMDDSIPGAKELCLHDMQETINAGFSWENAFLPLLNSVLLDADKRNKTIESFCDITKSLNKRIIEKLQRGVDADLILYLGLCNGAGWVTSINGKPAVLFGIEKIMELNWYDKDSMTGLVFHELGHVYQNQYGVMHREFEATADKFLWQLFTEGIAMVFEQELVGDPEYFHQDHHGWKQWCDQNIDLIRQSFSMDMDSMTHENQRYFGDWVSFNGYGDTGYYLGARFVRFLLGYDLFDRIILYGIQEVKAGFEHFLESSL